MIKEKIKEQMILAMKNKDSATLSTIRLINSKIKDKEINDRTGDNKDTTLDDNALLQLLQQMVKQRNDSIVEYKKGGREDLVAKEEEEIKVIKLFLPEQLNLEELTKVVLEAINHIKPEGPKEIGKVVAFLKEKYAGKIDISLASKIIKENL